MNVWKKSRRAAGEFLFEIFFVFHEYHYFHVISYFCALVTSFGSFQTGFEKSPSEALKTTKFFFLAEK